MSMRVTIDAFDSSGRRVEFNTFMDTPTDVTFAIINSDDPQMEYIRWLDSMVQQADDSWMVDTILGEKKRFSDWIDMMENAGYLIKYGMI